jgi:hypothetical protein
MAMEIILCKKQIIEKQTKKLGTGRVSKHTTWK